MTEIYKSVAVNVLKINIAKQLQTNLTKSHKRNVIVNNLVSFVKSNFKTQNMTKLSKFIT
jgi:kynureninase